MFKKQFGSQLKSIRKSKKLTQENLAELVGVDFRYISLIENGKSFPSADLIEKLAVALDVMYSDLFTFESDFVREDVENDIKNRLSKLSDNDLITLQKILRSFL